VKKSLYRQLVFGEDIGNSCRKTDPNWVIVWVKAERQKPGSRRNQRVFYKRTIDGEQNCITDREMSTTEIDYGCRLVDDRVSAYRE